MKLWIDDVRPAPEGYVWCKSVNEAKLFIIDCNRQHIKIELVSMDHDAGDYATDGGDYIRLLDWFERHDWCSFPIRLHTQNPVGRENMRRIIQKNGWEEVY